MYLPYLPYEILEKAAPNLTTADHNMQNIFVTFYTQQRLRRIYNADKNGWNNYNSGNGCANHDYIGDYGRYNHYDGNDGMPTSTVTTAKTTTTPITNCRNNYNSCVTKRRSR